MKSRLLFGAAILAVAVALPAFAGNNTFFTAIGDLVFPFSPPTNSGATPGLIDNMDVGDTTPAAGRFSTLAVDNGTKTATATGASTGAATLNKTSGIITSPALTTAAAALWTLTITDSKIAATDNIQASVGNGTNTAGAPNITTVTPGAGSVVIVVKNIDGAAALNGTVAVAFVDLKQ